LEKLSPKLIDYLLTMGNKTDEERSKDMIILVLNTLNLLLENCPNAMDNEMEKISYVNLKFVKL
jgi:hypothetical protein